MRDCRISKGHRHHEREDRPWQTERGPRYGNRRKEIAYLKWKARKAERSKMKVKDEDYES